MTKFLDLVKREPAVVTGIVVAALGVLSAFGLGPSSAQHDAIIGAANAVVALLGAFYVRRKVSPVAVTDPSSAPVPKSDLTP